MSKQSKRRKNEGSFVAVSGSDRNIRDDAASINDRGQILKRTFQPSFPNATHTLSENPPLIDSASNLVTDPRIESPSDEIQLIREKISKSEEKIEKNEEKLEAAEQKLASLVSSAKKNEQLAGEISRLEGDIEYFRRNDTKLKDIQLALLADLKQEKQRHRSSENALEASSLVNRFNEISDELGELRKERSRVRTPRGILKWMNFESFSEALPGRSLYFVDRQGPVDSLANTLAINYLNRQNNGSCEEHSAIPFMDDTFGMGKSTFGKQFVKQFIIQFEEKRTRHMTQEFRKSLVSARTVRVELSQASLLNPISGCSDANEMVRALLTQIHSTFNGMIAERQLKGELRNVSFRDTSELLSTVIHETKTPLFLVIDEIGRAFECKNTDVHSRRDAFMKLCAVEISRWLLVKDLHFILMGRGDIFNLIAIRPPKQQATSSSCNFKRISLNLIREKYYADILQHTRYGDTGRTLSELFRIEGEDKNKMQLVCNAIKTATNGHPRSMQKMLFDCKTIEDLQMYEQKFDVKDSGQWLEKLRPYSEYIKEYLVLIESGTKVDLNGVIISDSAKSITKLELIDSALIRWEGDLSEARLFVSPPVKQVLRLQSEPFKQFIMLYGKLSEIVYDDYHNFETACLFRFQELFQSPKNPGTDFPFWFHGTEFGKLNKFSVSMEVQGFPKVTEKGHEKFDDFSQKTIHPKGLAMLFASIKDNMNVTFRPERKSASSDILVVSRAEKDGTACLVTLGIAVKCYSSTSLSKNEAEREMQLFNRMFDSEGGFNHSTKRRLNVLMVCCTSPVPSGDIVPGSGFRLLDSSGYKNIDEAIYLDLSTIYLRQRFFGLMETRHSRSLENLERMIALVAPSRQALAIPD